MEKLTVMKRETIHFKPLLYMLILFSGNIIYAQNDCQVLMPEISESYTGKCKKGLAHGKGLAVGTDTYEGRFNKGLPNGSGKYIWADGRVYNGSWLAGKREGKGSMFYPGEAQDSMVTGFWKNDSYVGTGFIPPYKVIRSRSIVRSSIRKINEMGSGIRLRIYLGGKINSGLSALSIESDTGEQFQAGELLGIQNAIAPYSVYIKYRTWNYFRTQQHDVVFEFMINEPGTFEVTIHN